LNVSKPSRELSVEEIISSTLKLYGSKFLQFFLPFLIAGIITGTSTYAITSSFPIPLPPDMPASPNTTFIQEVLIPWFFELISKAAIIGALSGLILWIAGTTATGVVIKNASDQIEKGNSNLNTSFNFTISKLPSLLTAQFIAGILIVLGFFLFIIPGIIVAIMFSLILPAIIIEQNGFTESLGRSRKLVSNRWMKTFLLLLILGITVIIANTVASFLAGPLNTIHPIANSLTTSIISAFVSPLYPIAITYLYYAMLAREKPPPTPTVDSTTT
jgi:hypothetical protein